MKLSFFLFLTFLNIHFLIFSQVEKPNFKPYNPETTFRKLSKNYPQIAYPTLELSKGVFLKKNIVYPSNSPTNKILDLYINTTKKSPLIILIHGGGWIAGSKSNLEDMAIALSNRGYSVATLSYTLSIEQKYPQSVLDIKQALVLLKKNEAKWNYDTKKIAILGCSAGAQLATLVGVTPNHPEFKIQDKVSESVQAIINVDGIVSFVHPEASKEGKYASFWLGGDVKNAETQWKQASALEYVNKTTPPTLFLNSSIDRFHAGRDDMINHLKKWGIPYEVFSFKKAPHSFWFFEPWFSPMIDKIDDFLKRVLL